MRLRRVCLTLGVVCTLLVTTALCQDKEAKQPEPPKGGVPAKILVANYPAHTQEAGVAIGSELLTRKDVAKEFVGDVSDCCIVVLVAIYPKKDEPIDVSPLDFTLSVEGTDQAFRPQNASVIAAKLEKRSKSGPDVSTYGGVGYESGTYADPVTGQPVRVRGVTTSTGVAVANGSGTPADVAARDREVIEKELSEKGFPEGKATAPVAGYLYFPLRNPKKKAKYQLTYALHGQAVTLGLP